MGDIIADIENLNLEEEILSRHRKERKELQANIQALKKTTDKKRKREVLEEIVKLELLLDQRHADELKQLKETKTFETVIDDENEPVVQTTIAQNDNPTAKQQLPPPPPPSQKQQQQQRISKAQKRRDKKVQSEKEKQAEILAQEEINKTGPRMLETSALKSILKSRNLVLHPIASDGDCLYNAIKHQLIITGQLPVLETPALRNLTADYIAAHKDSLIFYMTNPNNGDILSDAEFDKYVLAVRSTPAWGGQIEIKALSSVLRAPIEVLQATGPPTVQNEDNLKGPPLIITYHRFMYSLGEHYNSTKSYSNEDGTSSADEEANIKCG